MKYRIVKQTQRDGKVWYCCEQKQYWFSGWIDFPFEEDCFDTFDKAENFIKQKEKTKEKLKQEEIVKSKVIYES
jgi:hypothetical protein